MVNTHHSLTECYQWFCKIHLFALFNGML